MEVGEERPVVASEAAEGPTTSRVDVTMAELEEERPSEAAEQEVVVEIASRPDVPSSQVDKRGPSRTVSSLVTEIVSRSV